MSLEHGSFADGTPLQSPLHVIIGAEAGPVLYVQSAVHGDEVNGVETVRRVVTSTDPEQMRGILLAVPITNGPGFVRHQRRNPFDEEDMNRIWPGKADGMISQHMANHFYDQAIRHAQYVIDLHTANRNTLLHVVYGRGDSASRKMAEIFGLEILLEEDISKELEQARFTGKLRNVLTARGVPAITPELGGNDVFEEDHIVLGMLEGDVVSPDRPQITLYGSHLDKVYANQGGIWVAQVQGGERVRTNQPLGVIYSLRTFEIIERPAAPYDGYVLGTADVPIVNIGDSLTAICRVDD